MPVRGTLGTYGETNRLATPTVLAAESLMRLDDNLFLVKLLNRVYQKYFSDQIGDEIHYKLPYYPTIGSGRVVDTSAANALIDKTRILRVDTWKHGVYRFNSEELTHAITDLGERYIQPMMEELAHAYDEAAGAVLGRSAFRSDGTAGTAINLAVTQDLAAHALYTSIPERGGRFCLMDPYDIATLGKEVQNLDANGEMVGMAIQDRYRRMLAGFGIYESTNIGYLDNHDYGTATPLVNSAGGYVGNMLPTDGWANTAQKVLNKGQLIRIAGVYEATMRGERKATGNLMTFTVTDDVMSNSSGQAVIPISPAINDGTLTTPSGTGVALSEKAFRNVIVKPSDDDPITVLGDKGKAYRQSIWAHRNIATCANVMIVPPPSIEEQGNAGTMQDPRTGLGITVVRFSKGESLEEFHRFDSKWGVDTCYPEMGIRLLSSEVAGG